MKLRIKSKLSLGFAFLFGAIVLTGSVGLLAINRLSNESQNILKANYESVVYAENMMIDLDKMEERDTGIFQDFEKNLEAQEANITEPGEQQATSSVRNLFENYRQNNASTTPISKIRGSLYQIEDLNMAAIVRKSNGTQHTADKAKLYLSILATICFLISFSFLLNFPGYIANPIKELTEGIKQIANKNYSQRINIKKGDEFGELVEAFNSMANQLNIYENSNLAKIIFEKKRIETIINGMKDPVIGLDENKSILFANVSAINVLGINESELVGKYAPDIAVKNDLLRTLIKEEAGDIPLKIYANAKESYFSRENLKIEVENKPIGSVILLRNITQFKELDLAKTNFIATISHELKTPIASIKMSLKLLEDNRIGNLNTEQVKLIYNIKEDTQRLLSITTELLDLAQLETGNIQLQQQLVEPHLIIDYAYNALKVQAEQKKLDIEIEYDPNLPKLNCDLEKTAWVVVNFLSNAIRYSPENNKVFIGVSKKDKEIIFSVKDFGVGIDTRYKEKVFERFYKIPNAGRNASSTGLGLAISKEFIIAQGGKIWVDSELGRGSTFYFSLPVAKI